MTVETITTFINSCGFPVVACVGMFYLFNKMISLMNDMKNSVNDMTQNMNNYNDTLKSMTELLNKILLKIEEG